AGGTGKGRPMDDVTIPMAIDHVGIVGRDMAGLKLAYERLGFRVTEPKPLLGADGQGKMVPLGQYSAHFMFADSYVELSAVTGEKPHNHLEPWLRRYEGLHILALATPDAEKARTHLRSAGLDPGPVQTAARDVQYGNGGRALFSWFAFAADAFAEAFVCMVEQRTPDIVFQPGMADHANGAVDLVGVFALAGDPLAAQARFQPFADAASHRFLRLMTARDARRTYGAIALPAPDHCLFGMQIRVRSLRRLADGLNGHAVPYREIAGGVLVAPQYAGGAMIVFTA
ncbi:MAG: VOC family protein, partial [Alphaproteobacteria bacterium]